MNRIFTKKFRNIVLILIALFILLFCFRLGYGYTLKVEEVQQEEVSFDYFESSKNNYASDKYSNEKVSFKDDLGFASPQIVSVVDQKYEKIADVKAATSDFDKEEKIVRDEVKKSNGIIQYERKLGNEGHRQLQLQIGVPPENFDSLYAKLVAVGITHSKEIIKNDKTNDYLELNARKASLEKTLASLINFKEKGGKIDEYINLENRILEIEEQLQSLGVNLGDFDKSNEFCTIKFALAESSTPEKVTISFYHRCKVALEWTVAMYFRIVTSLFFVLLTAFFIIQISEKAGTFLKWWKSKF